MASEWLTLEELSKYLKIKASLIYSLAQKGKLPGSKVGRMWRFSRERIDNWLIEQDKTKTNQPNKEGEK